MPGTGALAPRPKGRIVSACRRFGLVQALHFAPSPVRDRKGHGRSVPPARMEFSPIDAGLDDLHHGPAKLPQHATRNDW